MSDNDLAKLIELLAQKTGKRLTKTEALPKLLALLQMVRLVWTRMTEDQLYGLQKRRQQTGGKEDQAS